MAEIQVNPWMPKQYRFAGYSEEGVETFTGEVSSYGERPERGLRYVLLVGKGTDMRQVRELWNVRLTYFGSKDGAVQLIGYRPMEDPKGGLTGEFKLETWFVDNSGPTK